MSKAFSILYSVDLPTIYHIKLRIPSNFHLQVLLIFLILFFPIEDTVVETN